MNSICVFCGSSLGSDPSFESTAIELGKLLAEKKIDLVYGGSKIGIMGTVAAACKKQGGRVIGVIPHFLDKVEISNTDADELITTTSMHERKKKMSEMAQGFIALPGGFGTLEELCEILTWGQLGLIRNPIGILNVNGYYDHLITLFEHMNSNGLLNKENMGLYVTSDNVPDLLAKIMEFEPPVTSFHKKLNLT